MNSGAPSGSKIEVRIKDMCLQTCSVEGKSIYGLNFTMNKETLEDIF